MKQLIPFFFTAAMIYGCGNREQAGAVAITPHTLKRWYHNLGVVYGPVAKITEWHDFFDGNKTDPFVYIFSDSGRTVSLWYNDVKNYTVFNDRGYRTDSLVSYNTGGTKSTLYYKHPYQKSYVRQGVNMEGVIETYRLDMDTAKRMITTYLKDRVHTIDSFDAAGKLLSMQNFLANARDSFTYDALGHRVLETTVFEYPAGDFRKSVYTYKYDRYGNWIERTIKSTGTDKRANTSMLTKREVIYSTEPR